MKTLKPNEQMGMYAACSISVLLVLALGVCGAYALVTFQWFRAIMLALAVIFLALAFLSGK